MLERRRIRPFILSPKPLNARHYSYGCILVVYGSIKAYTIRRSIWQIFYVYRPSNDIKSVVS